MNEETSKIVTSLGNLRADLDRLDVTKSPLQREVERLRAENEQLRLLASALEPVPHGIYSMSNEMGEQSIAVSGDALSISEVRFGYEIYATAILPAGWLLMRPRTD